MGGVPDRIKGQAAKAAAQLCLANCAIAQHHQFDTRAALWSGPRKVIQMGSIGLPRQGSRVPQFTGQAPDARTAELNLFQFRRPILGVRETVQGL